MDGGWWPERQGEWVSGRVEDVGGFQVALLSAKRSEWSCSTVNEPHPPPSLSQVNLSSSSSSFPLHQHYHQHQLFQVIILISHLSSVSASPETPALSIQAVLTTPPLAHIILLPHDTLPSILSQAHQTICPRAATAMQFALTSESVERCREMCSSCVKRGMPSYGLGLSMRTSRVADATPFLLL